MQHHEGGPDECQVNTEWSTSTMCNLDWPFKMSCVTSASGVMLRLLTSDTQENTWCKEHKYLFHLQ